MGRRGLWVRLGRLRFVFFSRPPSKVFIILIRTQLTQAGLLHESEILTSTSYSTLWKQPLLRRTLIGINLQMFQQLTGINFIMYYGTTFFKSAGLEGFMTQTITGVVMVLFTLPGMWMIDRWGRRMLMVIGCAVMFLGMVGFLFGCGSVVLLAELSGKCFDSDDLFSVFLFPVNFRWLWESLGKPFPLPRTQPELSLLPTPPQESSSPSFLAFSSPG